MEDRFEPLRVAIDAEVVKGFAHAENELTRFLRDFPDAPQKIAALGRLQERVRTWPRNDLSRYLLLRIKDKRRYLGPGVPGHSAKRLLGDFTRMRA